MNTDVGPDDSVSNVSTNHKSHSSDASKMASTASSTCIKAKAEQATLAQRVAAVEKKHAL